jgi:hypothetical protein
MPYNSINVPNAKSSLSPELLEFAGEIQKDAPKSETKDLDFLAIAAIIMKFIELIVKFWQENKPKNDEGLQEALKSMGFIKRMLLKHKVKQEFGRKAWKDGLFQKTLDKVGTADYNQLSSIVKKDLKLSVRV